MASWYNCFQNVTATLKGSLKSYFYVACTASYKVYVWPYTNAFLLIYVRFEVLTLVTMKITFSCHVTPYNLVMSADVAENTLPLSSTINMGQ
jgi:hypothetical protein